MCANSEQENYLLHIFIAYKKCLFVSLPRLKQDSHYTGWEGNMCDCFPTPVCTPSYEGWYWVLADNPQFNFQLILHTLFPCQVLHATRIENFTKDYFNELVFQFHNTINFLQYFRLQNTNTGLTKVFIFVPIPSPTYPFLFFLGGCHLVCPLSESASQKERQQRI